MSDDNPIWGANAKLKPSFGINKIGHWRTMRQKRIDWLLKHCNLWEGFPEYFSNMDSNQRQRIVHIRTLMLTNSLYSKKTYWRDIECSIMRHIGWARQYRMKKHTSYNYMGAKVRSVEKEKSKGEYTLVQEFGPDSFSKPFQVRTSQLRDWTKVMEERWVNS